MSRREWEAGTITLPAADVTAIKKALRQHNNTLHYLVRAQTDLLHAQVGRGTRSPKVYEQRLREWRERTLYRPRERFQTVQEKEAAQPLYVADYVLSEMVRHATPSEHRSAVSIHKPTVKDVSWSVPLYTNRVSTFALIGLDGFNVAEVTFEGRSIEWSVPEGNHAVDRAHDAPAARLLFSMLERVRWTRSSGGGVLVGNDEYSAESREVGGAANYITAAFGPVGEKRRRAQFGL